MKIVVTGSSGRLGRIVVRDLLDHGHAVVPVDMKPPEQEQDGPPTLVRDLADWRQVGDLMSGADAVAHLGNLPGFARSGAASGFSNNVSSTFNVFHAARAAGVRRAVYASSVQAYGMLSNGGEPHPLMPPQYLPVDEDHPLLPVQAYPLSKATGEQIAQAFARCRPDHQAFSLRFSTILSDESAARWQRWQKKLEREASPEKSVRRTVWLAGSLFTWVHADDAARAVRLALEADRPGHTPLNIVSSRSHPEWSMELIEARYGTRPPLRRPLQPHDALFDHRRAQEVLGFLAELPRPQARPT